MAKSKGEFFVVVSRKAGYQWREQAYTPAITEAERCAFSHFLHRYIRDVKQAVLKTNLLRIECRFPKDCTTPRARREFRTIALGDWYALLQETTRVFGQSMAVVSPAPVKSSRVLS